MTDKNIQQDPPKQRIAPELGYTGAIQQGQTTTKNADDYYLAKGSSIWGKGLGSEYDAYDNKYLDQWSGATGDGVITTSLKALANAGTGIVMGIPELVGYAYELSSYLDPNVTRDYSNPLIEWSSSMAEDLAFKIRRENPDDVFAPGDFGWWAEGVSNVASSAAEFGMYGMGVGSVLRQAAKGAVRAGVKASVANAAAQLATSAALAYTEGAMAGNQVYKDIYEQQYQKAVEEGLTTEQAEAQANTMAENAAQVAVHSNGVINTLLNITSVAPIFKRIQGDEFFSTGAGARKTGESLSDWRKRVSELSEVDKSVADAYKMTTTNLQKAKKYGMEAGQESLEELVNEYSTQTGLAVGSSGETDSTFADGLSELKNFFNRTMTADGANSAFWGAIGGVGNTFVMDRIPMHRSNKIDDKGEYIPILDKEGKPTGKYQKALYSSRFIEKNRNLQIFQSAQESVLKDIDFVTGRMKDMADAIKAGNTEQAEAARRDLLSAHMLNAVYRGEGKNFENSLDHWAELDNETDVGQRMLEEADHLDSTEGDAIRASGDMNALMQHTAKVDELRSKAQKFLGKTEAMIAGVTDSKNDNSYKEDAANFKKDVQDFDKQFQALRQEMHGMADEQVVLEAARRILLNHIEARYLSRDIDNLNKLIEKLESELLAPDVNIDELIRHEKALLPIQNKAYNTYIHDYSALNQYRTAYERIAAGDQKYIDYWSSALGIEAENVPELLKKIEKLASTKKEALDSFVEEAEKLIGDDFETLDDYLQYQFDKFSINDGLIKALRAREDKVIRLEALKSNLTKRASVKGAIKEVQKAVSTAKKEAKEMAKELQNLSRQKLYEQVEHTRNFVNRSEFLIEYYQAQIDQIQKDLESENLTNEERHWMKVNMKAKQYVIARFQENLGNDKRTLAELIEQMSPIEAEEATKQYFGIPKIVKRLARSLSRKKSHREYPMVGATAEEEGAATGAYTLPGLDEETTKKFEAMMEVLSDKESYSKLVGQLTEENALSFGEHLDEEGNNVGSKFRARIDAIMQEHGLDAQSLPTSYLEQAYNTFLTTLFEVTTGTALNAELFPIYEKLNRFIDKLSDAQYQQVRPIWPLHTVLGSLPNFDALMDLKEAVAEGHFDSDLYAQLDLIYKDIRAVMDKFEKVSKTVTEPEEDVIEDTSEETAEEEVEEEVEEEETGTTNEGEPTTSSDPTNPDGQTETPPGSQMSLFTPQSVITDQIQGIDPETYTTLPEVQAELASLRAMRNQLKKDAKSDNQAIADMASQDLEFLVDLIDQLAKRQAYIKRQIKKQEKDAKKNPQPVEPQPTESDLQSSKYNAERDGIEDIAGSGLKTGTSIAALHMEYTEYVDENGVLVREQTGELNREANLDALLPDKLLPGTRIVAKVVPHYKGRRYKEYGGEYVAEDVDENWTDAEDKIGEESISSVPIELTDESTGKVVGYLHDRGWLHDSIEGVGVGRKYRNVDVLENYSPSDWEFWSERGVKSIETLDSQLMRMRQAVVEAFNKNPNESLVFSVTDKGPGVAIEYNGDKELSALELFPDYKNLEIGYLDAEIGYSGLPYLVVPSAVKGSYIEILLTNNYLSEGDVETVAQVITDYANFHGSGIDASVSKEAKARLNQVRDITGFNVSDPVGLKQFIRQFYFPPLSFDPKDIAETHGSFGFFFDVKTGSLANPKGQLVLAIKGLHTQGVELFDDYGNINSSWLSAFKDNLPSRRYQPSDSFESGHSLSPEAKKIFQKKHSGKLNMLGFGSEGELSKVVFNPSTRSFEAGETYSDYNEMVLSNSTAEYDGRNKVNGQYVYTVHPVVQLSHIPTGNSDVEVSEQKVETPISEDPVDTDEDVEVDDAEDWIMDGDEASWGADSVRIDPVRVQNRLKELSDNTEDHNGKTVSEAYADILRAGLFDVPPNTNPFRLCSL